MGNPKYDSLDRLFRKFILKKRQEVCLWCGITKPCDVAHILDKGRYRKMRYQENNVILLCRHCHMRWHDNPLDAARFVEEKIGNGYYDQLRLQDKLIPHLPDLKLLRVFFKQELKIMTAEYYKQELKNPSLGTI